VTAPINPHVHPDPHRINGDRAPADSQRSAAPTTGNADTNDAAKVSLSAAASVDVMGAISAENQAAAASAPEHIEAASALVSSLSAAITEDPGAARAAHGNLNGRAALSLLS
jgi:hypothetical protein